MVELLDIGEARQALGGVSVPTIYRLIGRGELPIVKVASRTFVRASDLEDFVARNVQVRDEEKATKEE